MNSGFNIVNKDQTPNFRGTENATPKLSEIECLIDWFQVTIFPKKDYKNCEKLFYKNYCFSDKIIPVLFYELFGINSCDVFKEVSGFNGYDVRYSYKDINIMLNSSREDMGINILLKGSGCRDFEDLGITWQVFFDKLVQFNINFNRIDIALDSFTDKYFTIELLKTYVRLNLCSSKFKNSLEICKRKLEGGIICGNTLQFGSKASDIEITFYDKYLERESKGYIVDNSINFWTRTELRFRHDHAEQLFNLINNNEDYSIFIKQILFEYIDFKSSDTKDSNKSRKKTVQWWLRFVDDCTKLSLTSRSSERRITKMYNWLLQSTSKTQLMVYFSNLHNINLDTISIELIYNLLIKGSEKITDKDLLLINDYRLANNMTLLSRNNILDYIQDLKDTILE